MDKKLTDDEKRLIQQLEDNTKLLKSAKKQLATETEIAEGCFASLIEQAKPEDRHKVITIKTKADALLQKARNGEDINDIIKQIFDLGK